MKKVLCCVLCFMTFINLLACQPTPEKEIVVNKGDGVLEQRIEEAQTALPEVSVSEENNENATVQYLTDLHWSGEVELKQLTIDIDVELEAPMSGIFPVYTITSKPFADADERIDVFLNTLLPDIIGVRAGGDTKEALQRDMQSMLKGVYDVETGQWIPPSSEEVKEIVAGMSAAIEAAPSEDDFLPAHRLQAVAVPSAWAYQLNDASVWDVRIEENHLMIQRYPYGVEQLERWVLAGKAVLGEAPHALENVVISQEEAEQIVIDFFNQVDVGDFGIAGIEKARIVRNYSGEPMLEGWSITCVRKCGDCYSFDYQPYGGGRTLRYSDEAYAPGITAEKISFFVNEDGIQKIYWSNPQQVLRTAAENIELLPFEEIDTLMRQAIYNGLGWSGNKDTGSSFGKSGRVLRMVLSACYVPVKYEPGNFYLIPTWFALIELESMAKDGVQPIAIAINAVDGSRIALEQHAHTGDMK